MKGSIVPIFVLSVLSASAFAAAQGQAEPQVRPSVGGAAPLSEHQGQALKEEKQQFAALDKNGDGSISHEEAQQDPALASYWKQEDLGPNDSLSRAEFAQFQMREEAGANTYTPGEEDADQAPGELPATPHQGGVTREGDGSAGAGKGAQ